MRDLPYLTGSVPPVAGIFKARWEDFHVGEIPRKEPEGRGDHTWLEVEKHGLTTSTAAGDLARALGVEASSVGYAGLKDARAVARQWMSVEHVAPEQALAVQIPRVRVLRAHRHGRKLRRGWHAGNRFRILLRSAHPVDPRSPEADPSSPGADRVGAARAVLEVLGRRGVPNYYGPQRFGYRGDTWRVGRALAREQWAEAAALIAGRPLRPGDPEVEPSAGVYPDQGDILRARELFEAGRYTESAAAWPAGFAQCRRLASAMRRREGDARRALPAVGKRMLRLYAEAYQAWLFNRVLARRIESLNAFLPGDLAWKHDTEALFLVDDPIVEEGRAERFEASPTGPLVGRRLREPAGHAREVERLALREAGFEAAELESAALRPLTGRRRPLRFKLGDVEVREDGDEHGPYLEVRFALPPGCYATAVLRELGKGRIVERSAGF